MNAIRDQLTVNKTETSKVEDDVTKEYKTGDLFINLKATDDRLYMLVLTNASDNLAPRYTFVSLKSGNRWCTSKKTIKSLFTSTNNDFIKVGKGVNLVFQTNAITI